MFVRCSVLPPPSKTFTQRLLSTRRRRRRERYTDASMLVLSSLNKLLSHVLTPPALHTAVLFTASGALVSFAVAGPNARPKDEIRVLVGLASLARRQLIGNDMSLQLEEGTDVDVHVSHDNMVVGIVQ